MKHLYDFSLSNYEEKGWAWSVRKATKDRDTLLLLADDNGGEPFLLALWHVIVWGVIAVLGVQDYKWGGKQE